MSRKVFLAFAVVFFLANLSFGADVKRLVVTCITRQEVSRDEIYVEFYVDGRPVVFAQGDQRGTSRKNVREMTNGDILTFDDTTRTKLVFSQDLRIRLREKNTPPNPDDQFADITLLSAQSENKSFEGGSGLHKWKYQIDWETSP